MQIYACDHNYKGSPTEEKGSALLGKETWEK